MIACLGAAAGLLVVVHPLLLAGTLGQHDKAEETVRHDKTILLFPDRRQRGGLGDDVSKGQAATDLQQLLEVGLGVDDEIVAVVFASLIPIGPLSTLLSLGVRGEHDLELIIECCVLVETGDEVGSGVFRVHEEGRVDDGMVRGRGVPLDRVLRRLYQRDGRTNIAVVKGGRSRVVRRSR